MNTGAHVALGYSSGAPSLTTGYGYHHQYKVTILTQSKCVICTDKSIIINEIQNLAIKLKSTLKKVNKICNKNQTSPAR